MDGTVKTVTKFLEYAEKLGIIDRIAALFKKPCTCLVLGSSGVGKTSFLNSIQRESAEFVSTLNRTLVNRFKKLRVDGEIFYSLIPLVT